MLHTAQVARAFLADRGHEDDGSLGVQLLVLEDARDRDHGGQAAAVVGNAGRVNAPARAPNRDLGFSGKDRIQVRCQNHRRCLRARLVTRDHIAYLINEHVQIERCELPGNKRSPLPLAEWRGGNAHNGQHILDGLLVEGLNATPCACNSLVRCGIHSLTT